MKTPKKKPLFDVHIMCGSLDKKRSSKWVSTPHYAKEYPLAVWLGKQEEQKYGKGHYYIVLKNGHIPGGKQVNAPVQQQLPNELVPI